MEVSEKGKCQEGQRALQSVVICDVCHTLYGVNTTAEFVRYATANIDTTRQLAARLVTSRRSPICYALAAATRLTGIDLGRRALLESLRGLAYEDIRQMAEKWVEDCLSEFEHGEVHTLLQQEQQKGAQIILASASLGVIVDAVARKFDADVVSSRLHRDTNGHLTGRLAVDATGCKHQLLEQTIDGTEYVTVITDNESDLPLLRIADRPIVVLRRGDASRKYWARHLAAKAHDTLPAAPSS